MLFVILLHGRLFLPQANNLPPVLNELSFFPAWAGVWIFLFLSGYGIATGFFAKKFQFADQNGKIRIRLFLRFYLDRFVKIAPLYYLYCFLFELLSDKMFLWNNPLMVFKVVFFFFNGVGGVDGIGHLWYISTAMQIYLLLPIMLLVVNRLRGSKIRSILFLVSVLIIGFTLRYIFYMKSFDWYSTVYTNFLMNLDIVLGGILIAQVKSDYPIQVGHSNIVKMISVFLFITLTLYNCKIYHDAPNGEFIYQYVLQTVYTLSCGLLLLLSNESMDKPLTKLRRFIYWLSGQTYCMYLFHIAVFEYLKKTIVSTSWFSTLSPTGQYFLFFSCAFPLIILVSIPMNHLLQSIVKQYRLHNSLAK